MSSNDEHSEEDQLRPGLQTGNGEEQSEERVSKRRKGRACDICRRRKIKCDGAENRSCTNCATSKSICSYVDNAKRRVPIHPDYVEVLKSRNQKLESLLSELFPNANLNAPNLTADDLRQSLTHTASTPADITFAIGERLSSMSVNGAGSSADSKSKTDQPLWVHARRFHGHSSGVMLLKEALNVRGEFVDPESTSSDFPVLLRTSGLSGLEISYYTDNLDAVVPKEPSPIFMFPPDDLMESLICLFFDCVNPILPIFHRPTFESSYHSKLHTHDPDFAAIMLLVCAAGSRHSEDLRVLPVDQQKLDEQSKGRWHSAGLDYFTQVYRFLGRPLAHAPALSHLQKFALACLYLQGSKSAQHAWALSGFGIRLALEAGAHRRRAGERLSIESQLWNRAFWALVIFDRMGSTSTGRPCAIQDEDIDVDLPVAVDDEYWDPPEPNDAWKQPPGKPAIAEYFRAMLKLLEILTFALRTMYSNERSRQMLGLIGPSWEQRVVAEIDSALNKWVDLIPDHLRWNPHQENWTFLNQSASLNCVYYQVQTIVHRPFITRSNENSPLSFSSLAICTNAARSSCHIMDIHRHKGNSLVSLVSCAFTSGIVLLLNIWGIKRLGLRTDPARHLLDVYKCMDWLKSHSKRCARAQLAWDTFSILLSAGDFPQPNHSPQLNTLAGMKRPRTSYRSATANDTTQTTSAGSSTMASHLHGPTPSHATQSTIEQPSNLPSQPFGDFWQITGVQQVEQRPFTSADLGLFPLYPELYYANGTESGQNAPTALESHAAAGFPNPVEDSEIHLSSEPSNASYAWPGVNQQTSFVDSGTNLPTATAAHDQQEYPGSLVRDDAVQPLDTYQEMFLGHDTLSMWATAPTSFEAGAWGEFAQAFQQEEHPAHQTQHGEVP